jgi:hypothetical protein
VTVFVFGGKLSGMGRVAFLVALQTPFAGMVIGVRPFREGRNNLIEVINELIFLIMTIWLLIFRTQNQWTVSVTTSFIWILISINFIVGFICLGSPI